MLDAWLAANAGEQATFVINLVASASPQALVKQSIPELEPYSFFMSRRVEDGRERFRLHWGPFATRAQAEHHLAAVRKIYPAAWIVELPARVPKAQSVPAPLPKKSQAAVAVAADPQAAAREPPPEAPAASITTAPAAPRRDADGAQPVVPQLAAVAGPAANAWVSFVIELRSSRTPIDPATLPPLPKLEGRVVYQVTTQRDGQHSHALRLGFFEDLVVARRLAHQLRARYPGAEIVAVTPAECNRASPSQPHAAERPIETKTVARRRGFTQLFSRLTHRLSSANR